VVGYLNFLNGPRFLNWPFLIGHWVLDTESVGSLGLIFQQFLGLNLEWFFNTFLGFPLDWLKNHNSFYLFTLGRRI